MNKFKAFVVGSLLISMLLSVGNLGVCTNNALSSTSSVGGTAGVEFVKNNTEMKGNNEGERKAIPFAGKVVIGVAINLLSAGLGAGVGVFCQKRCLK